jgi:fucose permease
VPGVNRTERLRPAARVLLVALAAFIVLGAANSIVGVAWPSIQGHFERVVSDLGVLIACGSAGFIAASLFYGRLHQFAGTGRLLVAGSTLIVVGLTGLGVAPSWLVVIVSSLVLGLGSGLVDTGLNAHAALAFDLRSMNLLHGCFGLGSTLGPIVMTLSLTTSGSWRAGYGLLAVSQIVAVAFIWSRRDSWSAGEASSTVRVAVPSRLRLALMLALFFLYTGVEVGAGQWAFTLLSEGRGLSTAAAGGWVAAYWGGLTLGRFVFGFVGDRIGEGRLLSGSMVVALLGLGVLWLDPAGLGAVGLPIAGIGLAAIFPTLVSVTPARLGSDRSTRTVGYQLASATVGVATIPWLLGLAAEERGLDVLAPGIFLFASLMVVVYLVGARERRRREPELA